MKKAEGVTEEGNSNYSKTGLKLSKTVIMRNNSFN